MSKGQNIPTTGRRPDFQARQLGYDSPADFAKSLPKNATVVDVGAGFSRFGHQVAAVRPDVRWINLDPCYTYKNEPASKNANVEFWADDIVAGSARLAKLRGSVDMVYSYWLLPHLSLQTDGPARAALSNMYDLLKHDGVMAIGPIKRLGFGFLSPWRYKGTQTYTTQQPKEQVIAELIVKTKLWWLPRFVQRFCNRHSIHFGARLVGGK